MVDSIDRILRGKTGFWRDIYTQRRRPFLRRNLNYILDQHELTLLRSKRDPDVIKAEMIANEWRHAGWDFPTADMLENQQPVLNITSIQLRHPESTILETPAPSRRKRISGDPDWLPHPDEGYALPCLVTVFVTDPRAGGKRMYADSRHACIRRSSVHDDHPAFDIQLDDRFACELEKLFVVKEFGRNGHRSWKRTATAKYTLDVSILCEDSDDTADLLSQLEGKPRESYVNLPASDGALKLVWSDLPECPATRKLLQLRRTKGSKTLELDYGAEVFMGWTRRRDSALVRSNRKIRHEQDAIRQLPTPSASDDQERSHDKSAITYIWKEGPQYRTAVYQGLECIFCLVKGEHSSFERLHLHYLTHHHHFKYEVNHDSPKGHKTIEISVDQSRAQPDTTSQAEETFEWSAPGRPFDITKFVNGEESWAVSGAAAVSKPRPGARRGKQRREPETDHSPAPPRERRKRVPTEVKDLAVPRRKRNSVPNVPDVRFYRTISKQQVEPGTVISDSDDDIDDRWLEQSQRRDLRRMGQRQPTRTFWELWNRNLDAENPSNDIFVTDFVVRLARKEQDTLRTPEIHAQFRSQLQMLQRQSVLEEETVAYCLEYTTPDNRTQREKSAVASTTRAESERLPDSRVSSLLESQAHPRARTIEAGEPVIEESPEISRAVAEKSGAEASTPNARKKRRNRWKEGRMEFGGTSSPPPPPLTREPPSSTTAHAAGPTNLAAAVAAAAAASGIDSRSCVCGKGVTRLRDGIACSNPTCGRDFHLECLNLERSKKRDLNWQCMFCAP